LSKASSKVLGERVRPENPIEKHWEAAIIGENHHNVFLTSEPYGCNRIIPSGILFFRVGHGRRCAVFTKNMRFDSLTRRGAQRRYFPFPEIINGAADKNRLLRRYVDNPDSGYGRTGSISHEKHSRTQQIPLL